MSLGSWVEEFSQESLCPLNSHHWMVLRDLSASALISVVFLVSDYFRVLFSDYLGSFLLFLANCLIETALQKGPKDILASDNCFSGSEMQSTEGQVTLRP